MGVGEGEGVGVGEGSRDAEGVGVGSGVFEGVGVMEGEGLFWKSLLEGLFWEGRRTEGFPGCVTGIADRGEEGPSSFERVSEEGRSLLDVVFDFPPSSGTSRMTNPINTTSVIKSSRTVPPDSPPFSGGVALRAFFCREAELEAEEERGAFALPEVLGLLDAKGAGLVFFAPPVLPTAVFFALFAPPAF